MLRALQGKFDNPPDYVMFPTTEAQIHEIMEFCQKEKIALIPFGGGSSVVGTVTVNSCQCFDILLRWS